MTEEEEYISPYSTEVARYVGLSPPSSTYKGGGLRSGHMGLQKALVAGA